MENEPQHEHHDAGKCSFELIDSETLFDELRLKKGSNFLDAGCGNGQFTVAASEIIGDEGCLWAIDLWEEGISLLQEEASSRKINNIKAMVGNISKQLPIEKESVDVCLMSTVLHGLVQKKIADGTFREIARALKPEGTLAVIEFKKVDGSPGPPFHIRLQPEEIERIAAPFGFRKKRVVDIGPYNYLITFALQGLN